MMLLSDFTRRIAEDDNWLRLEKSTNMYVGCNVKCKRTSRLCRDSVCVALLKLESVVQEHLLGTRQ